MSFDSGNYTMPYRNRGILTPDLNRAFDALSSMGRKYKTKFPMARIKKIMQLDNEIGKVALATPILISKALEVFMQNLVDEACKRVQNGGSTKLEPIYLKQCINETEEFDFLKDIVANVEDSPAVAPVMTEEVNAVVGAKDAANKEEIPAVVSESDDKVQNHKCSIATMLNDDPVTPPRNLTEAVDLNKDDVTVNRDSEEI